MDANIVEIYCMADEFSRKFDEVMAGRILSADSGKRHRNRKFTMSDREVVTSMILFHLKQFSNLKAFYTQHIMIHCREDFPKNVSYNRFVELQQKTVVKANTDDREPLKKQTLP